MSWREQLRDGSFRGVPFKIESHDKDFGRRVVVHEYPGVDLPETEDLGARPDQFSLRAYVLGEDYFVARDALATALERPGVGTLVHPYFGELQVVIVQARLVESSQQGGMARFDLVCLRAAPVSLPVATIDTAKAAHAAATLARDATDAQLQTDFKAPSPTRFLDTVNAVGDVLDNLEQLIGQVATAEQQIKDVIAAPDKLAFRLRVDIQRLKSLADIKRLFGLQYGGRPGADPVAVQNASVVIQAAQVHAVLAGVDVIAATRFVSVNEALATRDQVLGQFDAVMGRAGDSLYAALIVARTALATDVATRSANLARISRYTPRETLPAVVIAQALYGTAKCLARADDLCARNGVLHPGFVPGGSPLEVLSE